MLFRVVLVLVAVAALCCSAAHIGDSNKHHKKGALAHKLKSSHHHAAALHAEKESLASHRHHLAKAQHHRNTHNNKFEEDDEPNTAATMYPADGTSTYITWLENAVKQMIPNKADRKGNKAVARTVIHKTTFLPGESLFRVPPSHRESVALVGKAKTALRDCALYPGETGTGYATYPADRSTSRCDLEGMRYADLCASDNPVLPIFTEYAEPRPEGSEIMTLWEARHNKDLRANAFCPDELQDPKLSAKIGSTVAELRQLSRVGDFKLTYGQEAEVKAMKVKVFTNDKYTSQQDCYDQKLFRVETASGIVLIGGEGESASGVGNICWVELVTKPLPLDAKVGNTDLTARMMLHEVYTALSKFGSGTLSDEDLKNKRLVGASGTTYYVRLEKVGDTDETLNFKVSGWDKIWDGICQGNYLVPLSRVASPAMAAGFTFKKAVFDNAVANAEMLVDRLAEVFDPRHELIDRPDELKGIFTIYLYNMYWFTKVESKADTIKDLFDHLPKTPVMDLIRASTPGIKAVLHKWTTTDPATWV